jgi:DNA-binding transcriptional regulator YiaG
MKEYDALLEERDQLRDQVVKLTAATQNNRRKLSPLEVEEIRTAYRNGMSQIDLANNYGVNPATVSRTVRGFYH